MAETRITTIAERPDLRASVAGWLWHAFWRRHGHSLAEIEALVSASTALVGPPQCHVLLAGNVPAGTVSLIRHDLDERPDLTPWLAGLYVDPPMRGRGYARDLIRSVEDAARRASIRRIWLYTGTAEDLYLAAGWRRVETLPGRPVPSVLMRRDLD